MKIDKKPDNPDAFPVDGMYAGESLAKGNSGMTLRDYFAAKAMEGVHSIEESSKWGIPTIARYSYQLADEMLKQREI